MMNKSELLIELSGTMVKANVEKLAAIHFSISDLLDLSFYPKREIAFRASWILDYIVQKYPERFSPYTIDFLERYPEQENLSCRRHFAKIIGYLTDVNRSKDSGIPEEYIEAIVEKTFEWLIDQKAPVALQVYCMDVLFNLMKRVPWLNEELRAEIIFLLHNGSAAIQSRGKKILKKLNS